MIKNFKILGCSRSLKVQLLDSHLDYFSENLGAVSEEQGERFHEDIKEMERLYQEKWNVSMIAHYCWMLQRDYPCKDHKRKSGKRTFESRSLGPTEDATFIMGPGQSWSLLNQGELGPPNKYRILWSYYRFFLS
ncbi:hypothetical protein AVEN_83312-1 [Araneus ventricosus]|uniref:Uncharacterized protein n=1 Tax=Araneus ventricosus TaxID=182803 RepID=A0A4Y2VDK4_ARAVE|nr:hypothetical protein AVEN_83312-1 [Araneus ventricosus]